MADTIELILQPSGRQGLPGPQGIPGAVFVPSVSEMGDVSWTNNGGLGNPAPVNIKGPKGDTGAQGIQGVPGPQGNAGPTGPAGTDGKTPVRGTDYWTPEDKAEVVAEAVEQVKADAGSGLPEGAEPYQQIVTDGDGVAKWEDRTHWVESDTNVVLFLDQDVKTNANGEAFLNVASIGVLEGKKVFVTIDDDGERHETTCVFDAAVGKYVIDWGSEYYNIRQSVASSTPIFWSVDTEEYFNVRIEVEETVETIHPLDQKYLPDTVATKEFVENAVANAGGGMDGATFIPAVSEAGVISWTNNGGLENPAPVNIKGPKGDTGDTGPAGPAGATPVKGTDYYTAADKAEMVNAVLAALPTWTGGSY